MSSFDSDITPSRLFDHLGIGHSQTCIQICIVKYMKSRASVTTSQNLVRWPKSTDLWAEFRYVGGRKASRDVLLADAPSYRVPHLIRLRHVLGKPDVLGIPAQTSAYGARQAAFHPYFSPTMMSICQVSEEFVTLTSVFLRNFIVKSLEIVQNWMAWARKICWNSDLIVCTKKANNLKWDFEGTVKCYSLE